MKKTANDRIQCRQKGNENISTPSLLIAAPSSGSGKTMITCGLLKLLKQRGIRVSACKCGPDYIDPMFHEQALGVPSGNADTFFQTPEQILKLYEERGKEEKSELFVTEGVMGLYDGLGGIRQEGSAYHLARVLDCPVILVVDARGMGRSVLSLIRGFLADDTSHLIKGVIFNRMTRGMYETIAKVAESELGIRILGFVPQDSTLSFESRYLGLTLPGEQKMLAEKLRKLTDIMEESVDLEEICRIAGLGDPAASDDAKGKENSLEAVIERGMEQRMDRRTTANRTRPVRLAVARDEAFCFYYRENLRLLTEAGAELVPFSPLHDRGLPEDICGLYLGGGYPEKFAKELAANQRMKNEIRQAVGAGVPTIAECGGFLYLHERLQDETGQIFEMAGALQGECFYTGHLVRFGYVEIEDESGVVLRGHEFHYYDSTNNGTDCLISKPVSGKSYRGMHVTDTLRIGFPHLYFPSSPGFAEDFIEKMRRS